MAKTIYIDSGYLGHDSNPGTHPKRPKKTLASLGSAGLTPGDKVLLRYGGLWRETLVIPTNGVSYGTYHTGSESATLPQIDTTGTGIRITGQDNAINDIDIWHAETGLLVDKGANSNRLECVRIQDFGKNIIKASHTLIINPYIAVGRMVSNTASKSSSGAQAFTLWKEPNFPHTGTRITGAQVEQAWADALAFDDGDGAVVEIFGGVSDVRVDSLTSLDCTLLVEVGGTTARRETASNVVFARCLTMGSGGKVAFFNGPESEFYVNWEGFEFTRCTFLADEYDESPFFIAGNQGDLSKKLRLDDCIVVGTSQLFNGGTGTKLDSIRRSGNVYWRSDDGDGVGLTLMPDERFADPQFVDADARDYRVRPSAPWAGRAGALPVPPFDADVSGGWASVPRWSDMTAIPMRHRQAGKRVRVGAHRLTYELQEDKTTWLKV